MSHSSLEALFFAWNRTLQKYVYCVRFTLAWAELGVEPNVKYGVSQPTFCSALRKAPHFSQV